MTTTAEAQRKSEGRAPGKEDAALKCGTSTLSVDQSSHSVNRAVPFNLSGVQVVPVTGSRALERASVHDVLIDGTRVGGVFWARGAWRVLAFAQAKFPSRDDAVEALLKRRGVVR